MLVFTTKEELRKFTKAPENSASKIGFVPTMGALHIGHISLIKNSLQNNDLTIVSIFVNPTQFNNSEDLDNYPRTLNRDIELLKKTSENIIVFAPTAENLYDGTPKSISYDFGGIENEMEGKYRSGHFDGVGTVIKYLFNAVEPTNAYFGEKDFQQLQIIKKLVEIEQLSAKVIGCPIYRENSGLAFSSRNERLTELQRKEAKLIFETLLEVKRQFGTKNVTLLNEIVSAAFKNHELFTLEYFEIAPIDTLKTTHLIDPKVKHRAFIAVFAEQVRLIDNIVLN